MTLTGMMELLQDRQEGKIVLVGIGIFYIATHKDAIELNKAIGLKLSCMSKGVCKVGFPIKSLDKYIDMLNEKDYSYIVYKYISEKEELNLICEKEDGKRIESSANNINCMECKSKAIYEKTKYLEALGKLWEQDELKEELENENK